MSDDLPIDWNDPRVKQYLALIRLQVLTPLSLLINIFTACICTFITHPSLGEILRLHPTSITPQPIFIAVYIAAIWITQLGYCVLLILVRKQETKDAIIKGVGFPLVLSNWIVAACYITWVFQQFILSTVLLGILLLLLLFGNINLLVYHTPTWKRPLDILFIHTPMRFFLVWPFQMMFGLSLFISLGLTYDPSSAGPPKDYTADPWPGFAVVLGTNVISLIVIAARKDIVWCIASVWLCASIWAYKYVPVPVYATAILFAFLHPIGLASAILYERCLGRRGRQAVALEGDDDNHPGLHRSTDNTNGSGTGLQSTTSLPTNRSHAQERAGRSAPREVDAAAVWG